MYSNKYILMFSLLGGITSATIIYALTIKPLQNKLDFYKNQYIQNSCSPDMFIENLSDTEDEHWVLCRSLSDEKHLYKAHVKKFKE